MRETPPPKEGRKEGRNERQLWLSLPSSFVPLRLVIAERSIPLDKLRIELEGDTIFQTRDRDHPSRRWHLDLRGKGKGEGF